MEAKSKAEHLFNQMNLSSLKMSRKNAKTCAIIACNELINAFKQLSIEESGHVHIDFGHGYWEEVKSELEKM